MTTTLARLTTAYRKAKVDLYYSSNPSLLAIADYEDDLENKLESLKEKINGSCRKWLTDERFLGSWDLIPKSFVPDSKNEENGQCDCGTHEASGTVFASSEYTKSGVLKNKQSTIDAKATFRLMADCSIDFHVLAALWIMEVGAQFDVKLSDSVRGSRLRRKENEKKDFNELSLGSFKPYLKPFKDWRDDGIKAMQDGLKRERKLVALTADVTSYYHRLQPDFMLDKKFQEIVGVDLSEDQDKLNELFITALKNWAKNTPLGKGLPVGLPASAVVANMALFELDHLIECNLRPRYYGRYVDDIMLVIDRPCDFKSADDLWGLLINASSDKVKIKKYLSQEGTCTKSSYSFKADYLKDSLVAFENSKNKVFVLDGLEGLTIIDAIEQQIAERASEWRSLPQLPADKLQVATDLMKATNNDGEYADSLRKTDSLSLNRASFALKLRDFEAYERDLEPNDWADIRHAFFEAIISHVFVVEKYFELANYIPRITRLATVCGDFKQLAKILNSVAELGERIALISDFDIAGRDEAAQLPTRSELIGRWKNKFLSEIQEQVIASFPFSLSEQPEKVWGYEIHRNWFDNAEKLWFFQGYTDHFITSIANIQKQTLRLFAYDLAHNPLRFIGLPKECIQARHVPSKEKLPFAENIDFSKGDHGRYEKLVHLQKWMRLEEMPSGLIFSTRPYSLNKLALICPQLFNQNTHEQLSDVLCAIRGFSINDKMPTFKSDNDDKDDTQVLKIPDGENTSKQRVAVASWQTENESFIAAATNNKAPDALKRYQRLNRMLNHLLENSDEASYLIMPELSVPAKWFIRIADKLKGKGISLITGIEYLHAGGNKVRNQVWASLTHDGLGFPSQIIYRQDKQFPALHEESELYRLNGLTLEPEKTWKSPPVIEHRKFRFAIVVCSELTNIRYRTALRGKVDALFIPEWNQDTDTFNSLIEATALDVHAYVIQSNNRKFGDSRIRAPAKERYQRDILRVKGGIHDYCVTGEIDIQALRAFQSSHRSPTKPFKPVPDGFNTDMAPARKVLPKGEGS